MRPGTELTVAFDLPWPWGGEQFELSDIKLLNYIIGPLGSGKTRLAKRLAETLPDAVFLGLDRLESGGARRGPDSMPTRPLSRGSIRRWAGWSTTALRSRTP